MWHSAESIFIIEYLREYELKFKTALTHKSGIPGVLIDEKTPSSKISWQGPFKNISDLMIQLYGWQRNNLTVPTLFKQK
jgi:hypothetical protein